MMDRFTCKYCGFKFETQRDRMDHELYVEEHNLIDIDGEVE